MGRPSCAEVSAMVQRKDDITELKSQGFDAVQIAGKLKEPDFNPSPRRLQRQIKQWSRERRLPAHIRMDKVSKETSARQKGKVAKKKSTRMEAYFSDEAARQSGIISSSSATENNTTSDLVSSDLAGSMAWLDMQSDSQEDHWLA